MHLLRQSPGELLKLSSEVRHWLENRRTNVFGTLKNYLSAVRGVELSHFHLNPQPAVSDEHRKMVNRLWAYESLAAELAPAHGGIAPLRAAIAEFEQAWLAFEAARAAYRGEVQSGSSADRHIQSVVIQLEKVAAAVRTAIEATRTLDADLRRKK